MLLKIEFLVVTECSVDEEIEQHHGHLSIAIGMQLQIVDTFYGAILQLFRCETPQMISLFKIAPVEDEFDLKNKTEQGIKLN